MESGGFREESREKDGGLREAADLGRGFENAAAVGLRDGGTEGGNDDGT